MQVKKTAGPSATGLVQAPDEASPARPAAQAPFGESLGPSPAGTSQAAGLDSIVEGIVGEVRAGRLEPEAALDSIVEAAREMVAASLPNDVDTEQVLEYIRETLKDDPTFNSLLRGS